MLGSQIVDINPRIAGSDLSVPEVRVFGYCRFRSAVRTNDDWDAHAGPEIVFLIAGEACWEGEDERLIQAVGGQAVVFPKSRRHRILNSVYPPSESLWIIMKDADETDSSSLLTRRAHENFCGFLNLGYRLWDVGQPCATQVLDLSGLLVDPAIFSGSALVIAELRAKLHCVLLEFWKNCSERKPRAEISELVTAVKSLLLENCAQDVSIADIAARLGCSRGHLHAVFRREVGMSPNDYLQRLRIKRCCARLRGSTDTITAIAFDNGFDSTQYFARVFRKYLGFSPSEFHARTQSAAR